MKYRTNEIKVRLNDKEFKDLNSFVSSTGLSREQYIRKVLKNLQPVALPPLDYFNLIREIRRVGYNIRQIAQRAYILNMVDAPKYDEDATRILNICDELTMICLPRGDK